MTVKMLRRSMAAAGLLAMLAPTAASAFDLPGVFETPTAPSASPGYSVPTAELGTVPNSASGTRADERPVRVAQSGDLVVRINQLEDEMRRLNGRVEELSFQLLQAQEDMRKYREDSEFRFQQLEGGGSAPPAAKPDERRGDAGTPATSPSSATASATPGGEDDIGKLLSDGLDTTATGGARDQASGASGGSGQNGSSDSSTVASIQADGPRDMYDLAYNYLLAGDYGRAEASFRQYAQTYPNAKDAPDAEYWLGESLYQQSKYADAAEVFLDAQKSHPKSAKAPDMMLKLGMSLAKLNNRDTACVTFKEVSRRYPQMSDNVRRKLKDEEKAASC
ncbi:tol-pal system protein YbgF [Jiella mangrovi]|uniref:Cell division coordinator CpoB n=1 Tax=Jiella mangrovi TaxID=2821407 RepID=A0ABS4BBT6_9HYPH|nr:tol-pal system protein YbgF [Jiella mangrovi]MBP0614213.1 tol-pal system protein YbgF [Jiella mangrovi]